MLKKETEIIKKSNYLISKDILFEFVKSKLQMLKTASTLKEFSTKIKSAQIGETLTPETVQEIALEIAEVAEVASELASEIAEGVPAENGEKSITDELDGQPEQIEVAADETDEEKKKRMEKDAQDKDDDKDELKDKLASLTTELSGLKREAKLAKLAPKYASLFPKNMHEAKMNEIINSKQPLQIVEAKIQEASDIITNKTMVKIASQTDSIFDIGNTSDSEEVNIAAKL